LGEANACAKVCNWFVRQRTLKAGDAGSRKRETLQKIASLHAVFYGHFYQRRYPVSHEIR
jgi:hypothetical protein